VSAAPPSELERAALRRAVVALALAALGWFAPALFFGRSLLPIDERRVPPFVADADDSVATRRQNWILSDLQGWILGHTQVAVDRLKHGELPLWDSSELLGRPLHADASFPTFYPPDAIHLVLPVVDAYAWSMAFHCFWAAAGMLLLLRAFGLRTSSALVGAFAFGFSGWTLLHLAIPHFVRTAAWLPWLLLASLRLSRAPGPGRAATLSLCLGMAALSAYPTVLGIVCFALGAAALAFLRLSPSKPRAIAWHAGAVVLGVALGGVELLPIAELRAASRRAANLDEEHAALKSLRPEHLLALVAPDVQGNPVDVMQVRNAEGAPGFKNVEDFPVARRWFAREVQDNYLEDTLYAGVVPLLLAGVALASLRRSVLAAGLAALLLLTLFVAFHSPLQWLFRDWLVPGLGSGSPKRVLLLGAFALAGLAAVGFERLLDGDRAARLALLVGAALVTVVAAIAAFAAGGVVDDWAVQATTQLDAPPPDRVRELVNGACVRPAAFAIAAALFLPFLRVERGDWRDRRLALGGLALLIVGDLFCFGWRFDPFQPPEARARPTAVVEFLRKPENHGRTARLANAALLPASIASQWGVESVDGIQALLVREVADVLDRWQPGSIDPANPNHVGSFADASRFGLPVTRLLARWVVWSQPPPAELGLVQRYASEKELVALSEIPGSLPDAFFADRYRLVADRGARLDALVARDFAPDRVALVESEDDVAPLPRWCRSAESRAPGTAPPAVKVTSERLDGETLRVVVEAPTAGVVVVNEAWFPGWTVVEGDSSEPAIRVDHAFLGYALGSGGTHELLFRYEPSSFQFGAWLSLLALAGIGLLVGLAVRRRRVRVRS
jgi:hypothetical protein